MQEGYPPAVIRQEDRVKYYKALRLADERREIEALERMLDDYLWVLGLIR